MPRDRWRKEQNDRITRRALQAQREEQPVSAPREGTTEEMELQRIREHHLPKYRKVGEGFTAVYEDASVAANNLHYPSGGMLGYLVTAGIPLEELQYRIPSKPNITTHEDLAPFSEFAGGGYALPLDADDQLFITLTKQQYKQLREYYGE